jgi:hypothetical protein
MARSGATKEWIVLLESAPADQASLVDIGTLLAMLEAMGDEAGLGLHCADRLGVQFRERAVDSAMALSAILERWQAAAVRLLPPGWDVVRAEVLTPDEFARDCETG